MTRGMAAAKAAALFAGVAAAIVAAAIAGGCGCGEVDIVGDADADAIGDDPGAPDPDAWDTDPDATDYGVDVPDSPDETECLPCSESPDPWVRVAAIRPARIQNYPSIVWTGSEIGIAGGAIDALTDRRSLVLETVSEDTLGPGSGAPIEVYGSGMMPSLAWSGSAFAMGAEYPGFMGRTEIRFAPWDDEGPSPWSWIQISGDLDWASDVAVAWSGEGYGITWIDDSIGTWAVRFVGTDAGGEATGPAALASAAGRNASYPSVTWTGSAFLLSWLETSEGGGGIMLASVAGDGTTAGASTLVSSSEDWLMDHPSIAWSGSLAAITWNVRVWDETHVRVGIATQDGTRVGEDATISDAAKHNFWPAIAWGSCEFGVAWHHDTNIDGEGRLMFARVSTSGERVGAVLEVADMEAWAYPRKISMAWTGSEYAIAWGDYVDGGEVAYVAMVTPCR